jgi:hypothetical protein
MEFGVSKSLFQGLKQRLPKTNLTTPHIVDSQESIFDYEYLCEFESKIEKATPIVLGTCGEPIYEYTKNLTICFFGMFMKVIPVTVYW